MPYEGLPSLALDEDSLQEVPSAHVSKVHFLPGPSSRLAEVALAGRVPSSPKQAEACHSGHAASSFTRVVAAMGRRHALIGSAAARLHRLMP